VHSDYIQLSPPLLDPLVPTCPIFQDNSCVHYTPSNVCFPLIGNNTDWNFEKRRGFLALAHPSPMEIGTGHGVFVLSDRNSKLDTGTKGYVLFTNVWWLHGVDIKFPCYH